MGGESKYALKQKAKAAGAWTPPEVEAPAAQTVAEPEKDGEFADLGELPKFCAEALELAIAELDKAARVAAECERRSGNAIQRQEPRGIKLSLAAHKTKLNGLRKRAARMR